MCEYEYQCSACTPAWAARHHLADPVLTHCPAGGADSAKRLVGGAGGHRLKGDGWARDGYARPRGR